MIVYLLRNMWRRKARTFLTVFGIVVGIFALTVLGGMSARLNQQVAGAESWYGSHITVVPAGGSLFGGGGSYFDLSRVEEISRVEGVASASAGLGVFVEDSPGFSFGAPDLIIGIQLQNAKLLLDNLSLARGRMIRAGDRNRMTMGSALAEKEGAEVGATVTLRGQPFEVVGILETTLSATDQFAFVEYEDAFELFLAANPFFQSERVAGQVDVIAEPGVDYEELAGRIDRDISEVRVISPEDARRQISQFSLIFNAILLGIGLIALLVGGLSIINTMIMSVSERTREIGLKKAVGAETGSILGEYLLESALIGFFGGVAGSGLGVGAIYLLNRITGSSGVTVLAVTPMVVVGPVVFAVVLGTLAGVFPALRASRLKPVESLRGD